MQRVRQSTFDSAASTPQTTFRDRSPSRQDSSRRPRKSLIRRSLRQNCLTTNAPDRLRKSATFVGDSPGPEQVQTQPRQSSCQHLPCRQTAQSSATPTETHSLALTSCPPDTFVLLVPLCGLQIIFPISSRSLMPRTSRAIKGT